MSKELDYIAELEKENRLLGERCNQLLKDKGGLTDKIADIKANYDLAIEGRDIKIKELEQACEETEELLDKQIEATYKLYKENAELKGVKDVATLIRANNDTVVTLMQLNNKLVSKSQQLTKATELLNEFMRIGKASDEDFEHDYSELIRETEQFIREIEK